MLFNAVALASVLSLLAVTKATPIQMVPRSFQSSGLDCYYTCPQPTQDGAALTNSTADAGTIPANSRPYSQCQYLYQDATIYCEYYSDDGTLESGSDDFGFCPSQAPLAGCGADYANSETNPYNFKRSMIPRAKRETAAQRRIRSLQYTPKDRS